MNDDTDIALDLSGIGIVVRGLSPELKGHFEEVWAAYRPDEASSGLLDVEVRVEGDPVTDRVLSAKTSRGDVRRDRAIFAMREGAIDIAPDGRAKARIAPAELQVQYHALVNLICAALAWLLPNRGGALLHAAGIVLDGRAFVLVGASGSGKTTWARLAQAAGALYLSDDMVFVDGADRGVEVLSAPIRGDRANPRGPGRWPLAGILFPVQGETPRLEDVGRLTAATRLVANLPYLSDCPQEDGRIDELVQHLLAAAPTYKLTFAKDAKFLDCLRSLSVP